MLSARVHKYHRILSWWLTAPTNTANISIWVKYSPVFLVEPGNHLNKWNIGDPYLVRSISGGRWQTTLIPTVLAIQMLSIRSVDNKCVLYVVVVLVLADERLVEMLLLV